MAKAPPTIAATSTLAMVRTAGARGFQTADLLEEAGLTLEYLEDLDARIPGATVLALWNALRERTADPVLQLAAPASLPFGAYRIIDYLVAASATVGDGICRFASFFGLIADAVVLRVEQDDDGYCLCLARVDGGAVPAVYVDYVFAALVTRMRMRIRPGLQVRALDLRQGLPLSAARYRELFGAPVQFGAPADRLCFVAEEWNAPTETADVALARMLEEHARILAQRIPHVAPGFTKDVQKTIAGVLPESASADIVARALHVSVRTLQRRLVNTGTTFREIADSVRAQLAQAYLVDRTVSIAEVAFLLGFSDQTSFQRAFRRWTGEPPGRWRGRRAGKATRSAIVPRLTSG
jgi:AraC-like DNA-binding protein